MAMRYYQERESNQYQSRNKLNMPREAESRRDVHRTPLSEHILSSGYCSASIPPPVSGPPRASSSSAARPRSHSTSVHKNENMNSPLTDFGSTGKQLQSHPNELSSFASLAISPSNSRHPFASGEIEECDKYNPLILHHAQIQSVPQHRDTRVPLDKANYPLSKGYDSQKDYTHRSGGRSQEPRPQRHNLLYNQRLCHMSGKLGVLTPKATSAASTAMSIALAHGTTSSSQDTNAYKDSKFGTESQKSSYSRRMSLPEPPPQDRNATRRMSYTITSPPKLLDTIFQRVWNPQQTSPNSNPSPLAPKDQNSEQDLKQGQARSTSSSSIHPSSSSHTANSSSSRSSPQGDHQARRFTGRFIDQITFSLDENHKSGLQAILALRRLTNGLTSAKVTTITRVPGSRYPSPCIPIPRISHRYPEKSTTVIVNGQARMVNKKTIPTVIIDWSDGVRDEFDPSEMTLDEILARCYYPSSSGSP